jgi:hypothetical protein
MGERNVTTGMTQQDVRVWLEERVKTWSHDRMVLAHDHVAFDDFLRARWDEVARYQLKASALMSHKSVMRIWRFLYL